MHIKSWTLCLLAGAAGVAACKSSSPSPASRPADAATGKISRADFNRVAVELALPLFWSNDTNGNGALDPAELAVLWGVQGAPGEGWVESGALTPKFQAAYEQVAKIIAEGHEVDGLDEAERTRRKAVLSELSQGRPTLVHTDFAGASAQDRAIVGHVLEASALIEKLYLKQRGVFEMGDEVAGVDPASRMLFYRNQGPWCLAPATETDPNCNALPKKPAKISGLYPASIQSNTEFCKEIAARPDQATLFDHFSVVKDEGNGKLVAVPYNVAYADDMEAIATALEQAATAIETKDEAAFQTYLRAAAASFRSNDWQPADEAWSRMNAKNSKWYLRLQPDETYFEPCSQKAGFHVSFGRINQDSLEWQGTLDPLKNEMEQKLAELAGAPYAAREVSFHLPDFVDIVVNAGDSRSPSGATIGQSLPNWGPVANEGRGRTVAMTNFYTDADSIASMSAQVQSLLCGSSMASFTADPKPLTMSTVLHEMGHNLGPAHEYKVDGKTDDEVFGGPLASMMEELKAQTIALYFASWLADRGVLEKTFAEQAHTRDITWAFGHISRGMYTSTGRPKPYSQLAAVQLGYLTREGAVEWKADELAANGKDKGCYALHHDKFGGVIDKMIREVAGIKARGDKAGAEGLQKTFVDVTGEQKMLLDTIAERWLRSPKASFVYSVSL